MELHPEILTHPHIPKPMHGISPRTIEGQEWWDKTRREAYARYGYICIACGVSKQNAKLHQWLEAHEFWDIDYLSGVCRIKSIEPLCHYCHNFIHSGRLSMVIYKEKSEQEVIEILEHGFCVLSKSKLSCFPFTLEFAEEIGAKTYGVTPYSLPDKDVAWGDWKLIWNEKEYHSKFSSFSEWRKFYSKLSN